MKYLPFERDYHLESTPCVKCGGRGHPGGARDSTVGVLACFSCKGLGRRVTPAGRDLFYDVCALLGISVTRWPTRIEPFLVRGREFSAEQLADVDRFMASRVGSGAVSARSKANV